MVGAYELYVELGGSEPDVFLSAGPRSAYSKRAGYDRYEIVHPGRSLPESKYYRGGRTFSSSSPADRTHSHVRSHAFARLVPQLLRNRTLPRVGGPFAWAE